MWLVMYNNKKLKEFNSLFLSNKVNLLNFLSYHARVKALQAVLERGIKDTPGSYRYSDQQTTALLETGERIFGMEDFKEAVKQNIVIAKALIDHGSDVNYIFQPSKRTLEKINPTKSTYAGPIGKTVLMSYALFGCTEMVDYILLHGGKKTINIRNFDLVGLGAYSARQSEDMYSSNIIQSREGYRFENALSLAFCSTSPNSGKIMRLLLNNGADLSIFSDDEFYRPILFSAVATFDDHCYSPAFIRSECREKVKLVLNKMEQKTLHLTSCRETYKILSDMLSPDGYSYSYLCKFKSCAIM